MATSLEVVDHSLSLLLQVLPMCGNGLPWHNSSSLLLQLMGGDSGEAAGGWDAWLPLAWWLLCLFLPLGEGSGEGSGEAAGGTGVGDRDLSAR